MPDSIQDPNEAVYELKEKLRIAYATLQVVRDWLLDELLKLEKQENPKQVTVQYEYELCQSYIRLANAIGKVLKEPTL